MVHFGLRQRAHKQPGEPKKREREKFLAKKSLAGGRLSKVTASYCELDCASEKGWVENIHSPTLACLLTSSSLVVI